MIILENTKEYKDNKLAIPVGIGVLQTEAVKNFYNTSDADVTSADILIDKTAYGKYGKLTGTLDLDAEKEISYQDGYETGKTDGYADGLDDGITDGRNQIIEEQSDANITAGDVTLGKIGYGANNERIVGTSEAITSIDVGASHIKFGHSSFSEIPSYYDFSNCTTMSYMFYNCEILTTVPLFDTSNVTNMSYMFYNCKNLTSVPAFDTSKVTNMNYMFYYCRSLTSVPQFDTSKVTNMTNMFYDCRSLTSVPAFDTSKVTNMTNMFYDCRSLTSVPAFDTSKCLNFNLMFANCDSLIDVPELDWSSYQGSYGGSEIFGISYNYANNIENIGGFKDAGKGYTSSNSYNSYKDIIICYCPKLTHESCVNVINKVYDMNLNTQNTYTPKIRFHATPYALLSAEDIAIATSKGWTVQAG